MTTIKIPIRYSVSDVSTASAIGVTLGNLALTVSAANVKLSYSGASTIDVTLPGIDQFATISAAIGTTLTVKFNGVTLLAAPLTKVSYSQSPASAQIDLSASVTKVYAKTGAVTVAHIFSRAGESGSKSFDAAVNTELRPGMAVTTSLDTFNAGSVSFVLGPSHASMSVDELTAAEETQKAQVVASGVADRGYRTGSAAMG